MTPRHRPSEDHPRYAHLGTVLLVCLVVGCNPSGLKHKPSADLSAAEGLSFSDLCGSSCYRYDLGVSPRDSGTSPEEPSPDGGAASADGATRDGSSSHDGQDSTTCRISVSPAQGDYSASYTWQTETNGSHCHVMYDQQDVGPIDCNGSGTWLAEQVAVGLHRVTLIVDGGPGGPVECSTTYERQAGTDCQIRISPDHGDQNTIFQWSFSSDNGSNCRWKVDDRQSAAVNCNESGQWQQGTALPGRHTVTLLIGDGPGGATECSASYERRDTGPFDPAVCAFKPDFVVEAYCPADDSQPAIPAGDFKIAKSNGGYDVYYSNGRSFCHYGCWRWADHFPDQPPPPAVPCYVDRRGTTDLPHNTVSCIPRSMGCGTSCE